MFCNICNHCHNTLWTNDPGIFTIYKKVLPYFSSLSKIDIQHHLSCLGNPPFVSVRMAVKEEAVVKKSKQSFTDTKRIYHLVFILFNLLKESCHINTQRKERGAAKTPTACLLLSHGTMWPTRQPPSLWYTMAQTEMKDFVSSHFTRDLFLLYLLSAETTWYLHNIGSLQFVPILKTCILPWDKRLKLQVSKAPRGSISPGLVTAALQTTTPTTRAHTKQHEYKDTLRRNCKEKYCASIRHHVWSVLEWIMWCSMMIWLMIMTMGPKLWEENWPLPESITQSKITK